MGYILGIDLGTTYSSAAVAGDGDARIVNLGNRTPTIPSVVTLRADGEILVGEAAERRALTEPTRTAREFKRRLGDPTPLLLGGTPYGAETLMGHLLRWIVAKATEQQGGPPEAIVLSHPANWGPFKLDLLQQAVRLADVGEVSFITEPEAAAVHYATAERLETGQAVAVYDFGGGTFDAAVLRKTEGGFELIGRPEGMERIGGIDFDQAVFAHIDDAVGGAVRDVDTSDPAGLAAVSRLRTEAQSAKEALSQDTDVDIPVLLPSLNTEVRLTRPEFEQMIRPRITETIAALERAISSAGLQTSQVEKILLVGGTSRIPLVAQLVREATDRPIAVDAHPKHTIAIGAALAGAAGAARAASEDRSAAAVMTAPVAAVAPPAPVPAATSAPVPAAAAAGDGSSTPAVADGLPPEELIAIPARGARGGPPAWLKFGGLAAGVLLLVVILSQVVGRGGNEDPLASGSPSPGTDPYASQSPSSSTGGGYDPEVDIDGLRVDDDGLFLVDYTVAGFDPNAEGYALRFAWLDYNYELDNRWPGVAAVGSPFDGYDVFSRPVVASHICARITTPDGEREIDLWGGGCYAAVPAARQGLPGNRFVELKELDEDENGKLAITYKAYGFEPNMAGEGTNHLHFFFWPFGSEDTVGANISDDRRVDWVAWDKPVFDAWSRGDQPGGTTHICAVVAEYDHTILLQDDGSGYPSGTCLPFS